MSRWWWVRHGPTHQRAFTGWRDVPADLGDSAALERLDAGLPRGALLISSDLRRASATADCLARGRERLPPAAALREFHFGEWDGLGFAEVAARHPDLSRRYWEDPGDVAPPGGESWNAAAARVAAFVAGVHRAHPGRDIVAVAHLGVILTQLSAARGEAPALTLAQHIAPLSVSCIDRGPPLRVSLTNHLY
jgi:alpha-ribazole phosphatase